MKERRAETTGGAEGLDGEAASGAPTGGAGAAPARAGTASTAPSLIYATAADGTRLALTRVPAIHKGGSEAAEAVLLVHGFGQNRTLFHLPGRSFAAYLAAAGFDAYVLELRGHGHSQVARREFARAIHEYADLDVPAAVAALRARGVGRLHLVGHSMGGVACMAAPAEALAGLRSVVVMASPTHFGRGAPNVRVLSAIATRILHAVGKNGRLPRALPAEHIGTVLRGFREYFDQPLPTPLRIWEPGQIEKVLLRRYLAAGFEPEATGAFLDLARWARHGTFDRIPGRDCIRERLRNYPVPVLFIAGRQDWLVPPPSIRPGYELTRAPRKAWRLYGGAAHQGRYGHVDLLLSRHAPVEVWPQVVDWLRAV